MTTDYLAVVRLHRVWTNMRFKCTDSRANRWERYGGRGIKVDPRWDDFNVFCQWALDNGYGEGLELDRTDNDGDYGPENCRWGTRVQNQRNKSNNAVHTAFGETKCLAAWAEDPRCIVRWATLQARVGRLGWVTEEALVTPVHG